MNRDKDEAAYEARRAREAATTARPAVWSLVFAAAINGASKNAQGATQIADQALAAFDARFVREVPREGEGEDDEA